MTTTTTLSTPTVAGQLLDAIVTRDEDQLRRLFSPDVWFRVLIVRRTVETHDAETAIATFRSWFGGAVQLQVLHTATYPIGGREHLSYRLRLRPDWAPEVWHVIEQSGYARIHEGRVRRLDLVCTGFVPESAVDAQAGHRERTS
jgi:hypothetical protein